MKRGINLNILSVENITHSFTERKLFDKASFYLHEGDKVGVIGINENELIEAKRVIILLASISSFSFA